MPFILDRSLENIFIGHEGQRHAFWNIICWEYLTTYNFTEEHYLDFTGNEAFPYAHFETDTLNIANFGVILNNSVQRWCYPTNGFITEVLGKLCEVAHYCLRYGTTSENEVFKDTEYDTRHANFARWVAELWDFIPQNFKKPEVQQRLDFFKTWKEFTDWKKRFIEQNLQVDELTDRFSVKNSRITNFVFGWHREKAQLSGKSICHHLLTYIGGFVTLCTDNSIEPTVHEAEWAKIMGVVNPMAPPKARTVDEIKEYPYVDLQIDVPRRFSLPFLFRIMEADTRVGHGIGSAQHGSKAPRVVNAAVFQSDEANKLLVSFKGKEISGGAFNRLVFGFYLSGYQPTVLYENIQRMGDDLLKGVEHGLPYYIDLWATRPNFLDASNRFLGFEKNDVRGRDIPAVNLRFLLDRAKEDIVITDFRGYSALAAQIEAQQVVSDKHKQPDGVVVGKPKAKIEEEELGNPMAVIIAIGAFAVGFFALSS